MSGFAGGQRQPTQQDINGLLNKLRVFGQLRMQPVNSVQTQKAVKELQDYISQTYAPCSDEMLSSFANTYTNDFRYRGMIELSCGFGTAAYINQAVQHYVKNN